MQVKDEDVFPILSWKNIAKISTNKKERVSLAQPFKSNWTNHGIEATTTILSKYEMVAAIRLLPLLSKNNNHTATIVYD